MISQLFEENKNIIVNTDLDGVLSAILLTNYCGCKVVGYSNSCDKVWIRTDFNGGIFDCVYIDMYVSNKDVLSIDQHIISYNEEHNDILKSNNNKINPNIECEKWLCDNKYYEKYPFGTFHYILAELLSEGVDIKIPQLDYRVDGFTFGDIILRADDAMMNTIKYYDNAKVWWKYLYKKSNKSYVIKEFVEYLTTKSEDDATKIKENIGWHLTNMYKSDGTDGGYKNILGDNSSVIKSNFVAFCNFICDIFRSDYFAHFNTEYMTHIGKNGVMTMQYRYFEELANKGTINNIPIFSYAFISSQSKENNFSYTIYKTE